MRNSPGVVWRRTATLNWLGEHQVALEQATGGRHAVVEQPNRAQLAIEFFCESAAQAKKLLIQFAGETKPVPGDWLERCAREQLHPPIRVGRRLTVVADPAVKPTADTLLIPAGAAFGTGDHATTAMSLRLLEELTRNSTNEWSVLDAGTGSGILALAASRLGATEVIGFDNDPRAVKTAKANAKLNGIARVNFGMADVLEPHAGPPFDIITANLFSGLVVRAAPVFSAQLKRDGRLIVSGILRTQEQEVTQALHNSGLEIIIRRRRGKWIALAATVGQIRAVRRVKS